MRRNRFLWSLCLCGLLAVSAAAQSTSQESEGVNSGGYNIRQSIEFGGRIVDFTGSDSLWYTFVNQRDGVRLLGQTLEMRSLDHNGFLFDSLSLSSFGYGGDANSASRLRMSKGNWYKFAASFRRDHNFWDYNLFANPLNPATSTPSVPILNSPHRFDVVRRMSDINLTLAPLSPVRVRLGYNHNVHEGPSFWTARSGTETTVFQDWRNNLYSYQIGVDLKFIPRTNISYDQFFQRYKGDSAMTLASLDYRLANDTPVDLGLPFNTAANNPCAAPIADASTTPDTANPTCNGFTGFSRTARVRTSYPTEQLSFQSSYFANVDFSGRVAYSGAQTDIPDFVESFEGLGRNRLADQLVTGPILNKRVSVTADFGITIHATDKFRIVESFRWFDFRVPGRWDLDQRSLFSSSMLIPPNVYSLATCPAPFNGAGCPQHLSGSAADVVNTEYNRYLGMDSKINTIDLEYDFTRRIGARVGWRYRTRDIEIRLLETTDSAYFPNSAARGACAAGNAGGFAPDPATGVCLTSVTSEHEEAFPIHEHSGLFGFWTRPTDQWRISFDLELMSADHAFTRINPRNLQRYKLRATYKPKDWINVGAAVNILEQRNNVEDVAHKQHYRAYAWNVALMPNDTWGVDLSYNYNDVFSQTNICFVVSPPPAGSQSCGGSLITGISLYDNDSHFFSGSFMWRPIPRVTTNLGYTVTSSSGNTLILNPNQPAGPLQFNYHQPSAGVAIELAPRWTWKTAWNHYGYNEKGEIGPTAPRDFRGNVFTLSLRYGF